MTAEHPPQRRVQQVRGRVIAARGVASRGVDEGGHAHSGAERQAHLHPMDARAPRCDASHANHFGDLGAVCRQPAGIGDLPAGFDVERRLVEQHISLRAGLELRDLLP